MVEVCFVVGPALDARAAVAVENGLLHDPHIYGCAHHRVAESEYLSVPRCERAQAQVVKDAISGPGEVVESTIEARSWPPTTTGTTLANRLAATWMSPKMDSRKPAPLYAQAALATRRSYVRFASVT